MKTNELPLRDRIVAHLKNTGEATAAAITKAVGMADTPSRVTKELNAMRTDALIEAERKGKGPDLTYWLAVAQAPRHIDVLPDNIRAGTRAAQIWQVLPEHGQRPMLAREIVAATGVAKETIAPALTGMVKAGQVCRIVAGLEYAYTRMPAASQPAEIPLDEQKQEVVPAETAEESSGVAEAAEEAATVRESVMVPEATDERAEALDQIRALLADRVSGNIDPSDLSEVEIAGRAADMIDDAVDEISELQQRVSAKEQELQQQTAVLAEQHRTLQTYAEVAAKHITEIERLRHEISELQQRAQAQDQALQQQTALVAELRRALQASTELLTEQQDAAERAVADLNARLAEKDAELLRQAGLVVELRSQLDAALVARGDSPPCADDEDPSVDILQVAKAWHVVAKGYLITSAASIKAADRIARQLVRRENEVVTVGAWVPMFRYTPGVEVRSAR